MRRIAPSPVLRAMAFWLAGIAPMAGCDPQGDQPEPRPRRYHIAVIGEAMNDATWAVIQATALRLEHDYPSYHVTTCAPRTASPMEQQKLLEAQLDGDVNAFCIVPTDPVSLRSQIDRLSKRGKPVILVGRDLRNSRRRCYCGPSDLEIGETAAIACARSLAGRPQTVMLLTWGAGEESELIRRRTFREELKAHGDIEIVKEVQSGANPIDSVSAVRAEMRKYPRTGCWVFFDDSPLRVTPARDRLLPIGCRLVLCDGNPRHLDRLRSGEIQALVTYDFFEALDRGLKIARILAENPNHEVTDIQGIETETISATELDWYEKRWECWQTGRPSPALNPE